LDDCKQQNFVPFPFLSKYGETLRLDVTGPTRLFRATSYYDNGFGRTGTLGCPTKSRVRDCAYTRNAD